MKIIISTIYLNVFWVSDKSLVLKWLYSVFHLKLTFEKNHIVKFFLNITELKDLAKISPFLDIWRMSMTLKSL
jgi:hypothetical protein